MTTYTWERVSELTGLSMDDLGALSSGLDYGDHLTEDGRVTEQGLRVLLSQSQELTVPANQTRYGDTLVVGNLRSAIIGPVQQDDHSEWFLPLGGMIRRFYVEAPDLLVRIVR